MMTNNGVLQLRCLIVCFGISTPLNMPAQDSPPTPPLPPPPAKRTTPPFRPVPLRTGVDTTRPVPAVVPSVPVPLLNPPAVAPNPLLAPAPAVAPAPTQITNPGALAFDAEQKDYAAKAGEAAANFTFTLTNVSSSEVLVNKVTTSCGCTVAKLPEQPWHLASGSNGPINVTVDLRGKSGTIMKSVTVDSTAGMKQLLVRVTIPVVPLIAPATNSMDRTRNLALAQADRQAVFKSDCAECHVKPAIGKLGKDLYVGACAVCHDAEHRATMVPDLRVLKHPDTREYWAYAIAEGKANSLMPAFAQKSGGILTEQQVLSLVDYMVTDFPKDTNSVVHAPLPVPVSIGKPNPQANAGPSVGLGPFSIK